MKILEKYSILFLLIVCLLPVLSLLMPGFYGASDELHIAWLYEMDRAIKTGQFPPRFVPDLSYGFGYPLFNFVFPLPFYIGEIFHLVGLSLVESIKLVFGLSIPLSAVFMYLFLREFTNKNLSLLGAVLYIFAPYRAVDLYVRGAIGEIVAFVFLPLVALSVIKLTKNPTIVGKSVNTRWVGIGALTTSLLILSHNIATYMFLPFIISLALIRIIIFKSKTSLFQLIIMVAMGLLGSIYFWLPALLDSSLMKYDTVFNFIDHFPTIKQLLTPYWGYGASVPGPGDGMSFFLGVSSISVLIAGGISMILYWKKYSVEQKTIIGWSLLSLVVVIFMMNYRSTFIWQNLPLLPYFQFPWRFLIMTAFLIPILVITLEKVKFQWVLVMVLLMVTVGINYSYFRPQDFLGRTDKYFLNKYIPFPEASGEYKLTQEEYLRLPKNTMVRPDRNYPTVYDKNGLAVNNVSQINALTTEVETSFEKETLLNFNKYYFPGWVAEIDGKQTEITPDPPLGQISLKVPAGIHHVKVYFTETTFKIFLDIISSVSLFVSFIFIYFAYQKRNW